MSASLGRSLGRRCVFRTADSLPARSYYICRRRQAFSPRRLSLSVQSGSMRSVRTQFGCAATPAPGIGPVRLGRATPARRGESLGNLATVSVRACFVGDDEKTKQIEL